MNFFHALQLQFHFIFFSNNKYGCLCSIEEKWRSVYFILVCRFAITDRNLKFFFTMFSYLSRFYSFWYNRFDFVVVRHFSFQFFFCFNGLIFYYDDGTFLRVRRHVELARRFDGSTVRIKKNEMPRCAIKKNEFVSDFRALLVAARALLVAAVCRCVDGLDVVSIHWCMRVSLNWNNSF